MSIPDKVDFGGFEAFLQFPFLWKGMLEPIFDYGRSHDRTGLDRLLMGSVSEATATYCYGWRFMRRSRSAKRGSERSGS
jgi:hypothetical protein